MKKGIAMILTVILTVSMVGAVSAVTKLTDVNDTDWYAANVNGLVEKGIIGGYPDGSFKPNNNMNADEFIKTMIVALGYKLENGSAYWAQTYIDKAISLGIVKQGEFSTYKSPITRAQMCMISVRVVESLEGKKTYKYDAVSNNNLLASIDDVFTIKEQDKNPISNAYELGILGGYPNGDFKPYSSLKRSEACTVIRRVIDANERLTYTLDTKVTWETTVINGWTLPKENEALILYEFVSNELIKKGYAEISLAIILGQINTTLDQQYIAMEQALLSKFDSTIVDQVMDYVKLKTTDEYELPLKVIKVGEKYLWIEGGYYSGISVQLFNQGGY